MQYYQTTIKYNEDRIGWVDQYHWLQLLNSCILGATEEQLSQSHQINHGFFLYHNSLSDVNYGPCQTRLVEAIYSVHG